LSGQSRKPVGSAIIVRILGDKEWWGGEMKGVGKEIRINEGRRKDKTGIDKKEKYEQQNCFIIREREERRGKIFVVEVASKRDER